jgi:hypothetical protein
MAIEIMHTKNLRTLSTPAFLGFWSLLCNLNHISTLTCPLMQQWVRWATDCTYSVSIVAAACTNPVERDSWACACSVAIQRRTLWARIGRVTAPSSKTTSWKRRGVDACRRAAKSLELLLPASKTSRREVRQLPVPGPGKAIDRGRLGESIELGLPIRLGEAVNGRSGTLVILSRQA